jgi:hypothetical protein
MRDLLSDEYDSVAGDSANQLVPASLRRIGGALLFLGVIGAMGLWSYRLGTRDANEVPVIRAMAGPSRVAPEDPGGVTAAHQGLEVNSVLAGRAPVPEPARKAVPEPAALTDEDKPEGELVIAGTPLAAPEATAPEPEPEAAEAPASLQSELAAMIASVAPASAAAAPETAEAAPDARPKGRPANLALARVASAEPAPARVDAAPASAAPPRAPAAEAPAVREVSHMASGARMVQLGAYDSEAQARAAWARLVQRDGDLLGAKSLYVERATSNARVFYRLRVAGFDGADDTRRMCEALRGRGIDCIPVTLR